MLNWVSRFSNFCYLDNQNYNASSQEYECLAGAGCIKYIESADLDELDRFINENNRWFFGHLSFELKNIIYQFKESKRDKTGFPLYHFFIPQYIISLRENHLVIDGPSPEKIYSQIMNERVLYKSVHSVNFKPRISKEDYLQSVINLQQHIKRGDCYEINFCQEFYSEKTVINPLDVFRKLMDISPNPYSGLYRLNDKYLICASPERFLLKKAGCLLSEPMKGTIKRDKNDLVNDVALKNTLWASIKDKAENVMVADLVRNDLSRVCVPGSVKVNELFSVYAFPQVYQMVSKISGLLKNDISFSQIITSTFPMGSMTGAPKYRVMQLIDEYEKEGRGIFSGSIGYITPEKDFDFNVVIRSLMYNATDQYLSYKVGSGITIYSDPLMEWEECLLKAEAIKKIFS